MSEQTNKKKSFSKQTLLHITLIHLSPMEGFISGETDFISSNHYIMCLSLNIREQRSAYDASKQW